MNWHKKRVKTYVICSAVLSTDFIDLDKRSIKSCCFPHLGSRGAALIGWGSD
ncbi:hypothetical protein M3175_07025 [Robertmurraya korlensis]|uniref:hypothetical protein n=1 Tax=Robertmurraya korlensis TaxID=519977 RepID=UPI00203A8B0B|nr:hypothetical protein [Robertmurraya korlensis]MCM3600476.1 hypothetical protein [Robertmurraya korlensis]